MFAPRNSCPSDFRNKFSEGHKTTRKNYGEILNKNPLYPSAARDRKSKRDLAASPERAVSVLETATMAEALQLCEAKKDYILALGKNNELVGIITSTDIVYRIIAYGLDPRSTIVSQIMTKNLLIAHDHIDSNRALMLMVSHKIKHLPICNQNMGVLRVLHIRDVFNEYLENNCHKLDTSENLFKAVLAARTTLGPNEPLAHMLASARELVQKSSMPDFSVVAANQSCPLFISPHYSVRKVARIMKYKGASAVCITDHVNSVQNEGCASRRSLGLCALRDVAFYFAKFGVVALESNITRVMKNTTRVHPSTNFCEVARKMLKGRFSDTLVEATGSTPGTIVSILTICAAMVSQGYQHPSHLGENTDISFHKGSSTETKRNPTIAHPENSEKAWSPSTNSDSHPPYLTCPNSSGRDAAADRHEDTGLALNFDKKDNVPWIYETPPEYTPNVNSQKSSLSMTIDAIQHSIPTNVLHGHEALLALKEHYDIFHGYLPRKDHSGDLSQSTAQHKLIMLDNVRLFELSTDIYDELLRRQKAWRDEYTTPFLPRRARFSSVRNQDRQRLSSLSLSRFQDLVDAVYTELYQRYPALQEDFSKIQAMIMVNTRLADIFKSVSQYRRLLVLRSCNAQRLLDLFHFALDLPGLPPELRRNLLVATQRLSKSSGLFPTCFDLKGIELNEDHPVASGGFADIYKGYCGGQLVCLKVIRVYQTSHLQSFLKRISAEAILWGQLRHPNVLPFYGIYRFNNRLCLVSPWMDQDVKCFLSDCPEVNRRLLVSDVASGVAFLHSRDIVHGDLKGENILVNKFRRATIADFGLSSVSDPEILYWASHSTPASKGGSVRWQAPELFDDVNDEVVDNTKASDIYAFSCVAYEIFTEKLPFFELGKLEATILLKVKAGARPSCPTDLSPAWWPMRLTRSFWSLMESCWNRDPQERPSIDTVAAHADLKGMDTRHVTDTDAVTLSNFRHFMTSRSNPPSSEVIREILIDLEHLKDEKNSSCT